jgi:hypothetical protein
MLSAWLRTETWMLLAEGLCAAATAALTPGLLQTFMADSQKWTGVSVYRHLFGQLACNLGQIPRVCHSRRQTRRAGLEPYTLTLMRALDWPTAANCFHPDPRASVYLKKWSSMAGCFAKQPQVMSTEPAPAHDRKGTPGLI